MWENILAPGIYKFQLKNAFRKDRNFIKPHKLTDNKWLRNENKIKRMELCIANEPKFIYEGIKRCIVFQFSITDYSIIINTGILSTAVASLWQAEKYP